MSLHQCVMIIKCNTIVLYNYLSPLLCYNLSDCLLMLNWFLCNAARITFRMSSSEQKIQVKCHKRSLKTQKTQARYFWGITIWKSEGITSISFASIFRWVLYPTLLFNKLDTSLKIFRRKKQNKCHIKIWKFFFFLWLNYLQGLF